MDIQKAIRMAIETGEVLLGSNQALRSLNAGKSKMLVLASNVPASEALGMRKRAKMAGVPVLEYAGTSKELGSVCGKPYPISAMSIIRPGDSDILSAAQQ
ncbi:MAG: 50S ribosomal protein L30e [Candidatus Micrarchaeota archaeon]|nr:50S ribosomal protein L30e [Candidatus Micrarchaeota archaeon]